jgi:hypothetical protein
MADSADMIVPLLGEMRAENAALHEETRELMKALDKRLGAVERAQDSYRQALTADTLLSKLVTGEFEERIGVLERKMQELERLK